MTKPTNSSPSQLLPMLCILMAAGLLCAGLWPFNPLIRNNVTWLPASGGLEFGHSGVVYSSRPLAAADSGSGNSLCSLQIRIQPKYSDFNNSGTLLAFYTPENPWRFRLMQYRDELLIRKDYRDNHNHLKTVEMELEHAFLRDEPVSFTITSGPDGASAYRNGVRAVSSPHMGLSCGDFSGQLVLGEAPVEDNPWTGKFLDLAVYNSESTSQRAMGELAGSKANQHLQSSQTATGDTRYVARYNFSEGSGRIVHSEFASAPDLIIPENFTVLHKQTLILPWNETPDKFNLRDIAINIAGFVPFGLLLFAYLAPRRRPSRAAILTILAGAAISSIIEILQAYIPTRTSGILDILTNTFGTFLGVMLFRWAPLQSFASKLRLYETPNQQPGGN